jgi:hypothetical protein
MNNVLDYQGYRFFQSSFDPDEKGYTLSVNRWFWGTAITYAGYFMLFFAMMSIMFTKHSRFADLKRKLEVVKIKNQNWSPFSFCCWVLMVLHKHIIMSMMPLESWGPCGKRKPHAVALKKTNRFFTNKFKVTEAHASKFGRLVIQDAGGRMKPINTFSSELLKR